MQDREQREEEEAEIQQRGEREEARRAESPHSTEEVVATNKPRNERRESEIDTEGGGEASTS